MINLEKFTSLPERRGSVQVKLITYAALAALVVGANRSVKFGVWSKYNTAHLSMDQSDGH